MLCDVSMLNETSCGRLQNKIAEANIKLNSEPPVWELSVALSYSFFFHIIVLYTDLIQRYK